MDTAIERLAVMPAIVQGALHAASPDELLLSPGEGQFSLTEHACHLRDLEREGYLVRMRRILDEDCPALAPFDGAAVARERGYSRQDGLAAARDFAAARGELVRIVSGLDEKALAREGLFDGKRITLAALVGMILAHDHEHREEIEALAEALEAP